MTARIQLLVGTKKGAFIVESDAGRRAWDIRGPLCDGWPIQDISADPATGVLYAGGGSEWYGPTVFRSDDHGQDVDPVERRPHLRRRRSQDQRRLERDARRTDRSSRASARPACSGATTAARRGPTSRA